MVGLDVKESNLIGIKPHQQISTSAYLEIPSRMLRSHKIRHIGFHYRVIEQVDIAVAIDVG